MHRQACQSNTSVAVEQENTARTEEHVMRIKLPLWSKALVLGTTLTLLLAACGGDDPTPTPRPTATPVPAADPTATPTPLPPGVPTPTPRPATPTPRPPAATPTPSFDAAAYFKGKTIRLVANSSPGGGTDSQGRVMAAFISDWIPGNPRIVFTNQPNKPQEYLFAATEAPKDGTYISWNSTPQLNFGFEENTQFIKRTTFQFLGATIDSTRSWMTYDPVGNLGPSAADSCVWTYAGMDSTGGGRHGEFLLADEITDISDGNPTFLATVFALDQLDAPFRYFAFDRVDTNAVFTFWARGDINSTVRGSLWYRFPNEQPDWIPNGLLRVMAGMGPGTLKANAQAEPHCGDIRDHLADDVVPTYNALMGPTNYMAKALWLPPGTPDEIAEALSTAFETAFAQDAKLVQKYGAIAGEIPLFTNRADGTKATIENEALFETSLVVVNEQTDILLHKYFPQFVQ
jgi:hypothetical protein